ncbi:MAG TPA: metallophosphoesterase [Terracidiphilus sp.]|nr:metallophosphoesterase [Terracidiphilus sp.]
MGSFRFFPRPTISRRRFLQAGILGAAGFAFYAGEIARHELQVVRRDARIPALPAAFDGLKVAHLSDIHLDEFTEPFFLRAAVVRMNGLDPDLVFLTGDYVSHELGSLKFARGAAWQCANILLGLKCRQIYAVLGNHDVQVGAPEVTEALTDNGIRVLRNSYLPLERSGARVWLAGLDDPVCGHPKPNLAIPASIRNKPNEPVILLCHAPDYARFLLTLPAGHAVSLMLSGHTHGGQVRFPLIGPIFLPRGGKLFPEGQFSLGSMQLYVNRGLGTVGLPFRLNCRPEITLHTLRAA